MAVHPDRTGFSVPALCLLGYAAVWTLLAISPRYRADWVLENLPTLLVVPAAIVLHRRLRFSDRACIQAAVFGILHAVGSHYTYSEVPLGDWLRDGLGLTRNHYDRVVHAAFGVLAVRPARELAFPRGARVGRGRQLTLCVAIVASISVLYEIVEWLVAAVADPTAGTAFLGTQGDPWDAQKDMALACGGALIGVGIELWPGGHGRARRGVPPVHASGHAAT